MRRSDTISPTAHLTGYVWHRQGWSHPALVTATGRLMYYGSRPALRAITALGGPSLEDMLVSRHRAIDRRLAAAIESGQVRQVIEIAAGLSPRGWDFSRRYGPRIRYIEADLPEMARIKRRLLQRTGPLAAGHRVADLDALAEHGPLSLVALAATLDAGEGTAIITEGLLNYFDSASVLGMWRRFAHALAGFRHGLYLSDLHLAEDHRDAMTRGFIGALSLVVRGRVHLHFGSAAEASAALRDCGFAQATLHHPDSLAAQVPTATRPGVARVRIVEALTG